MLLRYLNSISHRYETFHSVQISKEHLFKTLENRVLMEKISYETFHGVLHAKPFDNDIYVYGLR